MIVKLEFQIVNDFVAVWFDEDKTIADISQLYVLLLIGEGETKLFDS